jgi:hypothetical protein
MPFTGEDLLIQLDLLDHISMPEARRMQMERELCAVLDRDDPLTFIEAVRASKPATSACSGVTGRWTPSGCVSSPPACRTSGTSG